MDFTSKSGTATVIDKLSSEKCVYQSQELRSRQYLEDYSIRECNLSLPIKLKI